MPDTKRLGASALPDVAQADAWIGSVGARLGPADRTLIEQALAYAIQEYGGKLRATGEPETTHALHAAASLAEMHVDPECIAAALLVDVAIGDASARERLRARFGPAVPALVEGVARMAQIEALGANSALQADPAAQLEALRKMLLAMVQDVRVVLVKLASHAESLRYLVKRADSPERESAARLALDIFAPLANRLGIWQLKWELEDLAFRIVDAELYKRIARMLDEKRTEREAFIADCTRALGTELERAGIRYEITGRPKHIYSIWKKMRRKEVGFDEVYDVSALRVFVDDVKDCYAALGIVHSLWTPIPKEFDDYIARPKGNDYRSLHTAVVGPGDRALEVQIRTHEMHREAELGVAAHWRYKEGTRRDRRYDEKVAWLRQVLEWKDEIADTREIAAHFQSGLFDDTVYVLTPQGKVIDLPAGSTPVDFAYHVHTDLGHRCRGARVDGVIVPLNTRLRHGQAVEVTVAKQGGPSRDWLNPALGFTASPRARAKVRQWFNAQNLEASIAQGRAIVERELQRDGSTAMNLEAFARRLEFEKVDDLYAAAGRGEVGPRQIQQALRTEPQVPVEESVVVLHKARPAQAAGGILVVGVDKLLTVPAKCCKPAPPDPIVGFVTRGRGVTIHRAQCANVRSLPAERLITADWGEHQGATYPVDIEVEASDRTGLLRDVSDTMTRERVNVVAANTESRQASARMRFTVEVSDLAQLRNLLALLAKVPGVTRAGRV
jgi:GTP pyrophosphokinase